MKNLEWMPSREWICRWGRGLVAERTYELWSWHIDASFGIWILTFEIADPQYPGRLKFGRFNHSEIHTLPVTTRWWGSIGSTTR